MILGQKWPEEAGTPGTSLNHPVAAEGAGEGNKGEGRQQRAAGPGRRACQRVRTLASMRRVWLLCGFR